MFWRKLFCILVILSVSVWYRQPAVAQAGVRTIPLAMKGPYMVVSPDGRTAAVFENGQLYLNVPDILHVPIRLIDLNTGEAAQQLSGFSDYASAAAFTPDGKRIVTLHSNGMIYVWDVASGKPIKTIRGTLGATRMKLFPDGKTLAVVAAGTPSQIMLWDLDTGYITSILGPRFASYAEFQEQMKKPLAITDFTFIALAASPDGKWLATATGSDEVALWDVATNKPTVVRPASEKKGLFNVRTLVFAADGKSLVYYDGVSKSTHIWDIASSAESQSLPVGAPVFALSPDGDTLVWVESQSGGSGSKVRLMKLSGEPQDLAEIPPALKALGFSPAVAFTPDGQQVIVGGLTAMDENNAIYVINVGG
ncbi:MAG: WD40 repeat domain-containing protein [Anaerolineae bacterium]|nr:WD40 repeat domain-containing protein [Anaerolineae bacterium]